MILWLFGRRWAGYMDQQRKISTLGWLSTRKVGDPSYVCQTHQPFLDAHRPVDLAAWPNRKGGPQASWKSYLAKAAPYSSPYLTSFNSGSAWPTCTSSYGACAPYLSFVMLFYLPMLLSPTLSYFLRWAQYIFTLNLHKCQMWYWKEL